MAEIHSKAATPVTALLESILPPMAPAKPVLHFSHANGFPAPSYRKMLEHLERDFRVGYIERLGHDPRFKVTDGWPHLVEQLLEHIEHTYSEPVVGIGHSLGGYLTLKAAVRRPDLFRCIVVMDSPIPTRWAGTAFQMVKRLGLVDRVTPAGITRGRRAEWASAEEAIEHFRGKPSFRDFDPEALRDYVTLGMQQSGPGLRLAFDPAVEYEIYRTIPHDAVREVHALRVPAGFVRGEHSSELQRRGLVRLRRHFLVEQVPGGHLFPFERPALAADAICRVVQRLMEAHPRARIEVRPPVEQGNSGE
jgi:pimeloyl-ACP methyl ester carboxylesterase